MILRQLFSILRVVRNLTIWIPFHCAHFWMANFIANQSASNPENKRKLLMAALKQIDLDVRGAVEFAQADRIVVFCVMTCQTFDADNHVHARGYAPLVGVPEDPFTGSMQGGLAAYLHVNEMITPDVGMVGSEQGHFIGRPGAVQIEITETEPQFRARMHANARSVFETEMTLP